jgi:hypothetical protein
MAGSKVRLRPTKSRKAAETLCMGMVAQAAALGWSSIRTAEAMSADELNARVNAIDHLGRHAVAPEAVHFVRIILEQELHARQAGKLVRIANPPAIDSEAF